MFNYMYKPNYKDKDNFEKNCNYAFYSYTVISNCEDKLTKKIFKDKELLDKLF